MTLLDKQTCWFFWGISLIYAVVLGEFFVRGLDITDESFYLINYEHWSELVGVVSFFGAYLSPPYYLLGESIWAIRFFGLFMLMAAAYFFALEFFKKLFVNELNANYIKIGATTVACAAVTFYSVFGTLYTPGYNLLNLVLMLFSTGLLLQLAQKTEPNIAIYFLYGLSMGAIFFTKFPSFFTTLAAHILLALLICSHERWWFIVRLLVAILAGMLVNYGYLALQARDILRMFSVGLENGALLSPRDILKETQNLLILDIPNIVLGAMANLLPIILRGIAIATLALFLIRQIKEWRSWSVFLIIAMAFGPLGFLSSRYLLNSSVWTAILLLWSICLFVFWRNKNYSVTALIKTSLLSVIVSLLPIAHSFGTGNAVQLAVGMSTVFPIAVCIGLLIFLRSENFIGQLSLLISLTIISLAPLFLIAMQWNQPDKTYRLSTGLNGQNINVRIGKAVVAVDDKTASAFKELKTILREHGYTEGTPMLDMTGSPGLVLVANGRPLGSAWLFVGYPGSEAVASSVLEHHVRLEEIRAAWILSTPSPNAGLDWIGIMRKVLGSVPFKKVGSFCLPVAEGKNSCDSSGGLSKTIEIWAPLF
jgi:4-amino-4-deoxy-L-arabinose transferase-like glycosyltransferase